VTLPASPSAISLGAINTELGVARSVTLYEPPMSSPADHYGVTNVYSWNDNSTFVTVYWGGGNQGNAPTGSTSVTLGGYTYYRGPYRSGSLDYDIRRTSTVSQTSANPNGPGSNTKISTFYAGAGPYGYVVSGDKGFPGGVATNVPLSGSPSNPIKFSNFHGMTRYFRLYQTVDSLNRGGVMISAYVELLSAGWNGTDPVDYQLTINSGVTLWSGNGSNSGAIRVASLPRYSRVRIINNGTILGYGGQGGNGGYYTYAPFSSTAPQTGTAGNDAIFVSHSWAETLVTITNNGTISGGGGGGGGGGAAYATVTGKTTNYYGAGGGGGGGGGALGAAGQGGAILGTGWTSKTDGSAGSSATAVGSGSGGNGGVNTASGYTLTGGNGGGGGYFAAGAGGTSGNTGAAPTGGLQTGAAGGGIGNYLTGNTYVSWAATGTRYGGVT